jgi:hypothetical protein
VTGDHIIPRSVCPELENCLFNLEMKIEMPIQQSLSKAHKRLEPPSQCALTNAPKNGPACKGRSQLRVKDSETKM